MAQMDKKELAIISHLRNDARMSLVEVAKKSGIPVSTVYDKVRKYESSIIRKHTCILDFQRMGYNIRAIMMMRVRDESAFRRIMLQEHCVNSVFRLNEPGRYAIDCVFRLMSELEDFISKIESAGIDDNQLHFVSEEVARENFLAVRG